VIKRHQGGYQVLQPSSRDTLADVWSGSQHGNLRRLYGHLLVIRFWE